jgi:hypothetical protein
VKPVRSLLEVDEFQVLLRAARYLDTHPTSDIGAQAREHKARGLTVTQIAQRLVPSVCYTPRALSPFSSEAGARSSRLMRFADEPADRHATRQNHTRQNHTCLKARR